MNSRQAWEDPKLTIAKLTSVNRKTGRDAEVMITDDDGSYYYLKVDVTIPENQLIDFIELSKYGDTAFINDHNQLVAWSMISIWNGTLAPAIPGGDIYE